MDLMYRKEALSKLKKRNICIWISPWSNNKQKYTSWSLLVKLFLVRLQHDSLHSSSSSSHCKSILWSSSLPIGEKLKTKDVVVVVRSLVSSDLFLSIFLTLLSTIANSFSNSIHKEVNSITNIIYAKKIGKTNQIHF